MSKPEVLLRLRIGKKVFELKVGKESQKNLQDLGEFVGKEKEDIWTVEGMCELISMSLHVISWVVKQKKKGLRIGGYQQTEEGEITVPQELIFPHEGCP